jgi:hypothetical protein
MNNLNEDLRNFFEKTPLYLPQKFQVSECFTDFIDSPDFADSRNLNERDLETGFANLSQIEMECPICKKSRPFDRKKTGLDDHYPDDNYPHDDYFVTKLTSKFHTFLFKCHTCISSEYSFLIEVDIEKSELQKIGQSPSWYSIYNNEIINKFLKDDAVFFTRALRCQSHGYGIGAFSYYRRVLENSIKKILENIRSVHENEGSSEGMKKIDEALEKTSTTDKIDIAKDAIPMSLTPGGKNPLKIIHQCLSIGIHYLSEDDCKDKSEHIRVALSYLITTLSQQNENQKTYIEKLNELDKVKKKSS